MAAAHLPVRMIAGVGALDSAGRGGRLPRGGPPRPVQTVRRLLDLDPDLATGLDPARLRLAEQSLVVRVRRVEISGGSGVEPPPAGDGALGLLIADGFVLRRMTLGHRVGAELLGPGDVVCPWQRCFEHSTYSFSGSFAVVAPLGVAVLDAALAVRLARFPEILAAVVARGEARTQRLAGQLVLAQLASVEHRLLLELWHLADLWGRVRLDGIVVPVQLTHEMLGALVGARRPSVTAALSRLSEKGLVVPRPGGFLLTGAPPDDLPLRRGTHAPQASAAAGAPDASGGAGT